MGLLEEAQKAKTRAASATLFRAPDQPQNRTQRVLPLRLGEKVQKVLRAGGLSISREEVGV